MARGERYVTTTGESMKRTSFAACLVIPKEPGAHTAAVGTTVSQRQVRFGWTMFTVMVMNRASQHVVTVDGEVIIATIPKM